MNLATIEKVAVAVIALIAVIILLCIRYGYLENKKVRDDIKVRNSNHQADFKIYFDKQCREYLAALEKINEFSMLLKLKADIDDFFGERPFIPNEYYLKDKVYKKYYARRNELSPQAGNGNVIKMSV